MRAESEGRKPRVSADVCGVSMLWKTGPGRAKARKAKSADEVETHHPREGGRNDEGSKGASR